MSPDIAKRMLVQLARAISPLGDACVLVGGAAHQLHASVAPNLAAEFVPLRTNDADVALSADKSVAELDLDERMSTLGFEAKYSGEDRPPATRFEFIADPKRLHYVEFVTKRSGDGRVRTVEIAGVVAARLLYVEILLLRPVLVELKAQEGYPVDSGEALRLHVAHPVCYLAQKLLALEHRGPDARAKDLVYVHDTLLMFASRLEGFAAEWREITANDVKLAKKTKEKADRVAREVTDDARRAFEIVRLLGRRSPQTAKELHAVLRQGLGQLFGTATH